MADSLVLTLTTGTEVSLDVDDGLDALKKFLDSHVPFSGEWIEANDRQLVRRDAIVSVRLAESEP
jgi:hypothetical protein